MACGAPVVASDRAALPETCGHAARLVDPDDHDAFAEALLEAAVSGPVRTRLVEAGHARAAHLTWQRTAEEMDAVVTEVLG